MNYCCFFFVGAFRSSFYFFKVDRIGVFTIFFLSRSDDICDFVSASNLFLLHQLLRRSRVLSNTKLSHGVLQTRRPVALPASFIKVAFIDFLFGNLNNKLLKYWFIVAIFKIRIFFFWLLTLFGIINDLINNYKLLFFQHILPNQLLVHYLLAFAFEFMCKYAWIIIDFHFISFLVIFILQMHWNQ